METKITRFENAELVAQMYCKNAVIEASEIIHQFLTRLVDRGLLKCFQFGMEIWNRGYQTKFALDYDYSTDNPNFSKIEELHSLVSSVGYVTLQPSSFFNDSYFKSQASVEGHVSILDRRFTCPFNIGNEGQIREACERFVREVAVYVQELACKIGVNIDISKFPQYANCPLKPELNQTYKLGAEVIFKDGYKGTVMSLCTHGNGDIRPPYNKAGLPVLKPYMGHLGYRTIIPNDWEILYGDEVREGSVVSVELVKD